MGRAGLRLGRRVRQRHVHPPAREDLRVSRRARGDPRDVGGPGGGPDAAPGNESGQTVLCAGADRQDEIDTRPPVTASSKRSNEFGLALLPVAPPGDPADAGIAIAPYTEGQIARTLQLSDELSLALTGAIGAIGGVVFSFRPSGASHEIGLDGALVSGTGVGMLLRYEPKSTVILVGRAGGTRLQIAAAEAGLTFDVSGGLVEVAASLETRGLSLVIGASDPDAFIGDALGRQGNRDPVPVQRQVVEQHRPWRAGAAIRRHRVAEPFDRADPRRHPVDRGLRRAAAGRGGAGRSRGGRRALRRIGASRLLDRGRRPADDRRRSRTATSARWTSTMGSSLRLASGSRSTPRR